MITKTYQSLSFGNAYYAFSCFHKAQDLFWAVNSLMQDCKKMATCISFPLGTI